MIQELLFWAFASKMKILTWKDTCTPMLPDALYTIAIETTLVPIEGRVGEEGVVYVQ